MKLCDGRRERIPSSSFPLNPLFSRPFPGPFLSLYREGVRRCFSAGVVINQDHRRRRRHNTRCLRRCAVGKPTATKKQLFPAPPQPVEDGQSLEIDGCARARVLATATFFLWTKIIKTATGRRVVDGGRLIRPARVRPNRLTELFRLK